MKYSLLCLAALCVLASCSKPTPPVEVSIIPAPVNLEMGSGEFELSANTQLVLQDGDEFAGEIEFFQSLMKQSIGQELKENDGSNQIQIIKSDTLSHPASYSIQINQEKISIEAGDPMGLFYAFNTIRQLLPATIESSITSEKIILPQLSIYDKPNFDWRGMHLDVSRHFFSIDYLRRYVDLLALYKLNKFHLHLTDDQGWRIQIKKYPELTDQGAWRTFNDQDSVCIEKSMEDPRYALDPSHIEMRGETPFYGGYYTQEELKDLVKYAQKRHVEIIPEIDMPGHMMAAIAVFPDLACNGEAAWGEVFSTPLCPSHEQVYTFVEDVLTEVMEIFPSKYIHIGADEVEKSTWEESMSTVDFMAENEIEDFDKLQSYFVKRVSDFLQSKGKEVMVWDDALEGGIDSSLNVMYWRNWVANVPKNTVENGNQIILTPGNPFYLSSPKLRLFDVYNRPLLDSKFPRDKMDLVKGMQACLWTETIPTEELADAKLFPNVLALAERAWSPDYLQDWDSFKRRLKPQLERLKKLGVDYEYLPSNDLYPVMTVDIPNERIGVSFETDLTDPTIYYTLDGSIPTNTSKSYNGEFFVEGSANVAAAIFEDGKLKEPVLRKQVDYHQAIGKPVKYEKPWNPAYPAGDAGSLTDGYRGGFDHGDGYWQGFTSDLVVTVDLEDVKILHSFSASFLQNIGPGIFFPESIQVLISEDGENFENVLTLENEISSKESGLLFQTFEGTLVGKKARFVKVIAPNSQSGFMFTDEIVIN